MDIIELRKDMQIATVNKMKNFKANYSSLIFDKENISALGGMTNMKITVKDNKLLYEIEMNEKIYKMFSREDLEKIKNAYESIVIEEAVIGGVAQNNPRMFILNSSDKKHIEKIDNGVIKAVKTVFEEEGIETDLYEAERWLYLRTVQKEWNFNSRILKTIIVSTLLYLDNFMIVPQFTDNEDDDTIVGIALFFSMDK